MKVKALTQLSHAGQPIPLGSVVDLPDESASVLLAEKAVELSDAKETLKLDLPPAMKRVHVHLKAKKSSKQSK